MKLENKVLVVTGGGNGIGREVVLALLKKNNQVAAVDINETMLNETKVLAGNLAKHLTLHTVNIADAENVYKLSESIIETQGHVDGIINVAGIIQSFVTVGKLERKQIERVMDVNFYGTLNMVTAFLPHLLKRTEAHILNVSSMGGFLPVPGQTIYGASKAGVKLLTEGLYAELLDTKVGVTVVFPGAIGTNISKNSNVSIREGAQEGSKHKTTSPQDAAKQIIKAVEKNKFRCLIGRDAKIMDFMYRLAPKRAAKMIAKKMKHLLDN